MQFETTTNQVDHAPELFALLVVQFQHLAYADETIRDPRTLVTESIRDRVSDDLMGLFIVNSQIREDLRRDHKFLHVRSVVRQFSATARHCYNSFSKVTDLSHSRSAACLARRP